MYLYYRLEVYMAEERKTIQIRANEELSNKFKAFTDEYPSMADGLEDLLRLAEIRNAKEIFPGMADQIETFRSKALSLVDIYVRNIEDLANARDDIRVEFNRTIEGLQNELIDKREIIEKLTLENKDLEQKNIESEEILIRLQDEIKTLERTLDASCDTLKTKDQIIDGHLNTISILSSKIAKLEKIENEIEPLKEDLYSKEIEINKLNNKIENLLSMDREKTVFYENQVKSIKIEYTELLENRLKEQERTMNEQCNKRIKEIKDIDNIRIRELEELNNKLKEELKELVKDNELKNTLIEELQLNIKKLEKK